MKFENLSASYDVGIAKQYGINCAVLLNKLIYLSKYTSREDGFCWKTAKELEDELGLSRNQQDLAIKKLEEVGILETKNTYIQGTQIKCKHFKIIKSEMNESNKCDLLESSKSEMLETSKSEMLESSNSLYNNKTIIIKHNNIYFNNKELNDLFLEFLDLRKKIKCKNTERAIKLLLNELNKYEDNIKIQMLNNSIMNSWKSVYPIKQQKETPKWFDQEQSVQETTEKDKQELEKIIKELEEC